MEPTAVIANDAGGLLAAMLERMKAERGDGCGIGMTVDAEDAAFFAQAVAIKVEVVITRAVPRLRGRGRPADVLILEFLVRAVEASLSAFHHRSVEPSGESPKPHSRGLR